MTEHRPPELDVADEMRTGRRELEPARLHLLAGGDGSRYRHAMIHAGAIDTPLAVCPACHADLADEARDHEILERTRTFLEHG